MRPSRHVLAGVCLSAAALSAATPAVAADSSTLGEIAVKPTIHAAGIQVPITGDDNANATVKVSFKAAGAAAAAAGHPLLLGSGPRALGSLLGLAPATDYELTLTLDDPDNAEPLTATKSFRTRADAPPVAGGPS